MAPATGTRDYQSAADSLKDKAQSTYDNVSRQVSDAADSAVQQGREVSENMGEVAHNFRSAFEKSMREQPVTTLAMAAGVAFILGALWKS